MLILLPKNWTKGWVVRRGLVAWGWKKQFALLLSILTIGCAGWAELSGPGGHGGEGSRGAAGSAGSVASSGGLASDYPGDVGIEADPDVIWAESFDQASVSGLAARYTAAKIGRAHV